MKTFYIVDIDDTILDIKGFVENSFGLEIKAIKEKNKIFLPLSHAKNLNSRRRKKYL